MDAARAGGCQTAAQFSGVLGVGASHECGGFLMPHLYEANRILPFAERFHDAVDAVAGQTEHHVDTPLLDRVDKNIGRCSSHPDSQSNLSSVSLHRVSRAAIAIRRANSGSS